MNKRFLMSIMATILFTTSCVATVDKSQESESSFESLEELIIQPTDIDMIQKNDMIQEPAVTSFQLEPLTEVDGLPVELVNRIREAVYRNEVEALISELSDNEFLLTPEKVVAEKELFEYIAGHRQEIFKPGRAFYRFRMNNKAGILEFENDIYGVKSRLYLKHSDKSVQSQYLHIEYGRVGTYFQYDGMDFILTSEYDYSEELACAALYLLSCEDDKLVVGKKVFFKEQKRLSDEQIVYAAEDYPDLADVIEYLQECLEDAVWINRERRIFFGDESVRPDLMEKFEKKYPGRKDETLICAIDVNNNGIDEFYTRDSRHLGSAFNGIIGWYDEELQSVFKPYKEAYVPNYQLKDTWFKEFNEKVLICSLYEKKAEIDQYFVIVQLVEQDETKTLLEYLVNLDTYDISLTESFFETYQPREIIRQWQISEEGAVYPDNVEVIVKEFITEITEQSYTINDRNVQKDSPVYDNVQQLITGQQLYVVDDTLGMSGEQIDVSDFHEKYYDDLKVYDRDSEGGYRATTEAVYRKEYADQIYYLLPYLDITSNECNQMDVYLAENDGIRYCSSYQISGSDSKIIQNSEGIFLVRRETNCEDVKYLPDITVHNLSPTTEAVIVFRPDTTGFSWKLLYSDQLPYETMVSQYIERIKEELMSVSISPEKNQYYIGDEKADLDSNLQARLKSVGQSKYDFYQADYNNDGQVDYILRRRDESFHLDFYHVKDNQVIKINYENCDYTRAGVLLQIWYQNIDDQVFTFQLFLKDQRYYILDVSLMKDTKVTPVQRYLIVPEVEYYIE